MVPKESPPSSPYICGRKKVLYLSVNVFSTQIGIIVDTILCLLLERGLQFLRSHRSHVKVQPFAGQRKYLPFLSYFNTLSISQSQESKPRPPGCSAVKHNLPSELIPQYSHLYSRLKRLLNREHRICLNSKLYIQFAHFLQQLLPFVFLLE